jgi:hypothetical protein
VQRPHFAAAPPRFLRWLVVAFATLIGWPAIASDPNVERQAQSLQKKAIEDDSLNLNYPEAIKKLATAISKCGEDKCNPTLKGQLYRDLGAVLILSGSVDDGRAAFLKALTFDASLELDPAYKTPMLEQLWRDAKKKGGAPSAGGPAAGGGGAAAEGTSPGTPPAEGGASVPPQGDFAHVPAGSQLVRTPLPIYAEYLGTEKLLRVVVKYRGAGMSDWKPLELRKLESGYAGLIPCKDVTAGAMQYYIQGYGTSDDPVAASGTRTKPYSVPIKTELTGPAPSLPGEDAPKQCPESTGGGDCPPDFPGCHAQKKGAGEDCARNGQCESGQCFAGKCVEKKGEGEECDKDGECSSGTCSDGKCTAPKKSSGDSCDSDDDCSSGTCRDGKCTEGGGAGKKSSKVPKIWIGIGASLDLISLPSSQEVCRLSAAMPPAAPKPLNSAGYQCVDPSGQNFPGTNGTLNDAIKMGVGDSVAGGFAPGNLRLMASFDYALSMNVLLGARAGYVLFTDPASSPGPAFPPVHLEARFTYLFGKDALASSIAPFALLAAGLGEFDASFGVQVVVAGMNQPLNENAWIVAGPFFASGGLGLRFLLGSNVAATVALKGEGAFGGSAGFLGGVAPELGMQFGL